MRSWIEEELSCIDFEDERLDSRMLKVLEELSKHPSKSIPSACSGHSEMTAAYRFFSNEKVTFDGVLEPHIEQSKTRISNHPVVLLIADSTEIENKRPNQNMDGVGYLSDSRRGMLLHPFVAFTPQRVPLGIIHSELINRAKATEKSKSKKNSRRIPIEDKESYRWLVNQRIALELAEEIPETQFITIYDSEADIFDVLSEFNDSNASVDYIVRGCQNRRLVDEGKKNKLHDKVLDSPVLFKKKLSIRSKDKKVSCNTKKRGQERKARKTEVQVRATKATLLPPEHKEKELSPVHVNVVLVSETKPPKGQEKIEWMLVTTLPINNKNEIRKIIQYYCTRWMIEVFFKVLKSGCRIEKRRFLSIDNFRPCLALYLIIAWRVLYVCHLSREYPNISCQTVFSPAEWKSIYVIHLKKKPPKKIPTLDEIAGIVAKLGGYIKRKNSPPGPKNFWVGLQRLHDIAMAWEAFTAHIKN
jgi:hypothetical protein